MWVREAHPQNQAETVAPLTAADGNRVLAVSLEQVFLDEMKADFRATSGEEIVSIWLDRKRKRKAEMFIAEGFTPAPRDPVTGKPIPKRP